MKKVCLFTGSADSFNLKMSTDNFGKMLSDEYILDVVTTGHDIFNSEYFNLYKKVEEDTYKGEFKALNSYLSKNSPDAVLQINRPPKHGNLCGVLSKRHKVPFVYRYSGDRFYEYTLSTGLKKWLVFCLSNIYGRIPLHLADRYIVLGPKGYDRLTKRGVNEDKISVLPPPIDLSRFRDYGKRGKEALPQDKNIVLFVGRMSWFKGIDRMEKAIPKAIDKREDLHFVFVGGNKELNVPEKYDEDATVEGEVPPNEVPQYFNEADVLVHPSRTEGLPRVILESLATETPVIASDVGEIPSVTDNIFTSNEELVDMICRFEELPVDDVEKYSCTELKKSYVEFLKKITNEG